MKFKDAQNREDRKPEKAPANERPSLPDPKEVLSETIVTSLKGTRYRILHTNEKDPYDPPDPKDATEPDKRKKKPDEAKG